MRCYQSTRLQIKAAIKSEEHIALIEEPEGKYIGHVSLNSNANAKNIVKNITAFTETHDIDLQSLMIIGCDGTTVNTGWKGGVIRLFETQIGRPLQWSIGCYIPMSYH